MEKKIKILRIINRFNIGGPTYNATFLTRFISDEFETLLIGGLPEDGEEDSLHILEEYGVQPMLIQELKRNPSFQNDRKALKKIKDIIREYKPDIVHTHASKAGALGRTAAIDLKVPVVVHTFHGHVFHSYFGKFKTYIYKTIERRLARKSSGIIAISELQKNELTHEHKICGQKKVEVITLGFDLKKFNDDLDVKRKRIRDQYAIGQDEVAIAIIGRLVPVKDHNFFLDVIARIQPELDRKVAIFIVGDGPERQAIEQKVKTLEGKSENCRFVMTSWVKDIGSFNAGMDIICLTSKNEGTPVSLIEAQAANIPVISTDVGGVRDVVQDGVTGYVIPKYDLKGYAEKLLELVKDEKKRQNMSQNGWNFVEHKFHYTTLVENMENYYRKLLQEKGSHV